MTALELLDTPELNQKLGICTDIIGSLDIQIGEPEWIPAWATFVSELASISSVTKLTGLVDQVKAIRSNVESAEDQFAAASVLLAMERAALPLPAA